MEEEIEINNPKDVGEFLRAARLEKKMTLPEVGKAAGYSHQTVSHLENDKHSGATFSLIAISQAVGVKIFMKRKKGK